MVHVVCKYKSVYIDSAVPLFYLVFIRIFFPNKRILEIQIEHSDDNNMSLCTLCICALFVVNHQIRA